MVWNHCEWNRHYVWSKLCLPTGYLHQWSWDASEYQRAHSLFTSIKSIHRVAWRSTSSTWVEHFQAHQSLSWSCSGWGLLILSLKVCNPTSFLLNHFLSFWLYLFHSQDFQHPLLISKPFSCYLHDRLQGIWIQKSLGLRTKGFHTFHRKTFDQEVRLSPCHHSL